MRLAQEAAQKLETKPNDKVCCSVTLLHAFGAASAVGSAVVGDAAVILPEVGGIRGCGSPSQRAQVTADVIATEGVTQLFGDTHTLRALQDVEAPARASHHLRTGVIKIGSGSDFLDGASACVRLRAMMQYRFLGQARRFTPWEKGALD